MNTTVLSSTIIAACSFATVALAVPATPIQPAAAQKAPAEPKKLVPGHAAPAVELSHVVKGEVPDEFEDGKVYVVEFWATWCPPCRSSMPHLSSLQDEYEDDVQIIGISDEDLETVTGFMKKSDADGKTWDEKIRYTLVTDPDRSAHTSYMQAAQQRGIPTAFIVGKSGDLEWIGHPMTMDEPLDQIVNDKWDREAYMAKKAKEDEQRAAATKVMRALDAADTPSKRADALKSLDKLIAESPDNLPMKMAKYDYLLEHMSNDDAAAYGNEIAKNNWDDSQLLNGMSWTMVISEKLGEKGKDFAMKAAKRADELTDSADPMVLDTLARCYFVKGNAEMAVKIQKKAIDFADGDMANNLKPALKEYEEAVDKA